MAIKSILTVDDSPTDLTFIKSILSDAGFTVYAAASGEAAVESALTHRPDLIFLDIVMPGMDGFATCRQLRDNQSTQGIPVVFVSSKSAKADRVWAQLQGGKALISKPYSADQIIEQINIIND